MRRLIAGLACAACVCLPAHALASVHAGDVAATRAYLGAAEVFARSTSAEIGVRIAALEARASEIGGECPSVLTYAPRDGAFEELGEEAGATIFYADALPVRSMMLGMAHTIEHLRWSNPKLTRLVRAEAAEEGAIATIWLPDVCADIAAWKANGYAALPPSSASYLARVRAIESLPGAGAFEGSREAAVMHLLRTYESPAERQIARRIERFEAQLLKRLNAAGALVEEKLEVAWGVAAL